VEDGIPGWLQHCHETCCKKGGHCGRQACMIWRWFHHMSSLQMVDLVFLYFTFHFYFIFDLFFYFLFLEQPGLGLIGHAVTSVTI